MKIPQLFAKIKKNQKNKPKKSNSVSKRTKAKQAAKKNVYTSVKTRSTRPFFNKSFGASSRADFEEDKFRYYVLCGVICSLFIILLVRAFYIQVVNSEFYNEKFAYLNTSKRIIPTHRGMIVDRNNLPLAIDAPLSTVIFNPREYAKAYYTTKAKLANQELGPKKRVELTEKLKTMNLNIIANIVNVDVNKLKKITKIDDSVDVLNEDAVNKALPKGNGSQYYPLLREVSHEVSEKILALEFIGIYKEVFDKRFYPQSHQNSQLVGFMSQVKNQDSETASYQGRSGLEIKHEKTLAGKPGAVLVLRDGRRAGLKEIKQIEPEKKGEDLQLTIDSRLQYLLYKELRKVGREQKAFWSSGIVVDVKTGEVLAMSTWPSYNANNLNELTGENQRNRPISDNFEPGSVMKPFTIAAALQSGKYSRYSTLNTSPGSIRIRGYTIKDHKDFGNINLTQLLKYSSNVGSTKIALSLPAHAISDIQRQFGFGKVTSLDLPTEKNGQLVTPTAEQKARRATVSYGYGLQVTLAQLAQAYAALGSGGVINPLSIVKKKEPTEVKGKQILSQEHALSIVEMMESVTERGGTAPQAAIDGYRVAGKTGTSRRINPKGGYYQDKYRTVFVGIAPVSNPRFVTAILVENPQKDQYAGDVSAPAFKNVMKEVLRLYSVPLDKPLKTQ